MIFRYRVAVLVIIVMATLSFVDTGLYAFPFFGQKKDVRQEKAPDFTLNDLQGRKFKLSENKGKPVLLVFGATWCPYCREEIPQLKNIYAKYVKKGLVLVNIDIEESRQRVLAFANKYKLPYRVLLDIKADVARSYGVQGIPMQVLIGRDGTITCRYCRDVEPLLEKMFRQK